ncbi:hypothetical protein [Vibrio sp. H11]|uniref:hypothetical protein n=1 Tax=Vibrio sp. H11 TaxID=2565928 RepID=UPI0010A5E4EA|nr:hypothetical protein [Vibrio sp. H11]
MRMKTSVMALGLFSSLTLYGCGSDNDSPAAASSTYSVKAIDGYLRGALVWLDLDQDFQLDDNEPSATSQSGGVAELDVSGITNPEDYPVVVQAIRGETVDEDTGNTVSNDFTLSAPPGTAQVTPLSTLVHIEVTSGSSADVASAQTKIANQLGISEQDTLSDYKASGSSGAAFAARSLVSSGSMPQTPQDLNAAATDNDGSNELLDNAVIVAVVIKAEVESKSPEQLDSTYINSDGAVDTDSDGDGVADSDDAFPDDATEWADSDNDDIGDNADTDDDGDNVADEDDAFPFDPAESVDTDGDGIGDNADTDDDNDGVADGEDDFPLDEDESLDTDGDGTGNNADPDDDNDGVADGDDAFPLDEDESVDTDGDGTGNNADTDDDDDGVPDAIDDDPLDDSVGAGDTGQIIQYLQQQTAVYALYADDDDNDQVRVYSEMLTINGTMAMMDSTTLVKADKTEVSVSSENSDLVLTESGWSTQTGLYTIDFSDNALVAYPSDHTNLRYTLSGSLRSLAGSLVADTDIDWDNFNNQTATYPQDAYLISLGLTPAQNNYYMWDWTPYIHDGPDNSHEGATSLSELIFAEAGSSSLATSELQGMSIGDSILVKFVEGGVAQYYQADWQAGIATLVASSTWEQQTINNESLLLFTLPQDALTAFGDAFDEPTPHMLASVYQGAVYIGNMEMAGIMLDDEDITLFSDSAKNALLAAADIPLNQCSEGDNDGLTSVTMSDFEAAIESCYGSAAISEDMVAGNNFHRVRGDGSTRDYSFNADYTMTIYRDGQEGDTTTWAIENGYIKITDSSLPDESWYWALVDSSDTQWSLKFFETYSDGNGDVVTEIWSDTVALIELGACSVEQGLGKSYTDFTATLDTYQSCSGVLPTVSASDLYGAELLRIRSNGETRLYTFATDGSAEYYRDGMVRTRKWLINDDGFIELRYSDDSTAEYLALLAEPQGDDVLEFAVFSPEDAEIWLTQYTSIDGNPEISECTQGNTDWDDVNDVPLSYVDYSTYLQAVNDCLLQSESQAAFSNAFMAQLPRTMSSTNPEDSEAYIFNSDGVGSFTDGTDSYAFTWTVDDASGELAVTLTAGTTIYVDNMHIVDTDGVNFSLKVMSRSTEWQGIEETDEGEVWTDVYSFE